MRIRDAVIGVGSIIWAGCGARSSLLPGDGLTPDAEAGGAGVGGATAASAVSAVSVAAVTSTGSGGGAGSGGAGGSGALPLRGILAGVSIDQSLLAFYRDRVVDPVTKIPHASLWVMSLPSGNPVKISDDAFVASFRNGNVLTFQEDGIPTTDPGSGDVFGTMHLWTPALGRVDLTQGLGVYSGASNDNSVFLIRDTAEPKHQAPGTLLLVRVADCMPSACAPIVLAEEIISQRVVFAPTGKFAAVDASVKNGGFTLFTSFLVDVEAGTMLNVGETNAPPPHFVLYNRETALSPDGTKIGVLDQPADTAYQLHVASTPTGQSLGWTEQPAGTFVEQVEFFDDDVAYVHVDDLDATWGVYRATKAGFSVVDPEATAFGVARDAAGYGKYLFTTTSQNGDPLDVSVRDPVNDPSASVPISLDANDFPRVSDDATAFTLLTDYDKMTGRGTLIAGSLSSGASQTIASDTGSSFAFARGSNQVVFIRKPPGGDAGRLSIWQDGTTLDLEEGVFNAQTRAAPSMLYFSITEPVPPAQAGIFWQPMP